MEEVTGEDMFIVVENLKKQISELEDKLANADYQLEGRDNEIKQAKEIIKNLLKYIFTPEGFEDKSVIEDAEKFVEE